MITQEVWMDLRALVRQGDNFSQIGALGGWIDGRSKSTCSCPSRLSTGAPHSPRNLSPYAR